MKTTSKTEKPKQKKRVASFLIDPDVAKLLADKKKVGVAMGYLINESVRHYLKAA